MAGMRRPTRPQARRPQGGGGSRQVRGGNYQSFGKPRPNLGGRVPAGFGGGAIPHSQGGKMHGAQAPQRDYFAEFNAWTDPNISGQQPGPISQGYGGFQGLDTMTGIKMNNFLNQFAVGGDRERASNALGYFNYGNPYTPQVQSGYNRGQRAAANSGQYTEPGIYQHQARQPTMMDNGSNDLNSVGGYTGFTTVGEDGAAQYTPFDINAQGGGRRIRRRGGTTGGYIY